MIWKLMPDNWASRVYRLQAPSVMPYFVDGEAYARLQRKEGVELTPLGASLREPALMIR